MSNWTRFRDSLLASATSALIEKLFGLAVGGERKKKKGEMTEINPTPLSTPDVIVESKVVAHPTFKDISEPVDDSDRAKHLRFGASTGLLIKAAERGGIVVLLPGEYGSARRVALEGPRGVLELSNDGFANPHRGLEREHWRDRSVNPKKLMDTRLRKGKLGPVGKVRLVVDEHEILIPKRIKDRVE
jgi:hypothetical protein